MSRLYAVRVKTMGIEEEFLNTIFEKEFGGDTETFPDIEKKSITLVSDGIYLCGGESDDEAHDRLSDAIKEDNPDAKVQTTWTYLEDLPQETYGDDLSE